MQGTKTNNTKHIAAKGSTLVELSIVMALLSIVATMIATFSALVVTYVNRNQASYDFIEESSAIREDIADWLSKMDVSGGELAVSSYAMESSDEASLSFHSDSKSIIYIGHAGERVIRAQKAVESVKFELSQNDTVLKCTVYGSDKSGEIFKRSFAFSLRAAEFTAEVESNA